MQLYLKDGMEIREVQFTNEEVQNVLEKTTQKIINA